VVMATHGRSGLGRLLFGSVADQVLRNAEVPILLVPANCEHFWTTDQPASILVSLDGSELSETILGAAVEVADALKAELSLLRVADSSTPMPYADSYLEAIADRLRKDGTAAEAKLIPGQPAATIATVAREQDANLIAMATHGRSGLARLVLGSVATETLRRAHVPLLLVRPAALSSPAIESGKVNASS
jgi:nucleotide-binding universal stress UspA family protein